MRESADIRLRQTVKAPPSQVWRIMVVPQVWWGADVALEPKVGGRFVEPWRQDGVDHLTSGEVVAFEPSRLLALRWRDEDWSFETVVELSLSVSGADTHLALCHRGWEAAPAAERAALVASHRSGWRHHLRNLAAHAEAATEMPEGDTS